MQTRSSPRQHHYRVVRSARHIVLFMTALWISTTTLLWTTMHSSSRDSKIKTAQYHQYNGQVEPAEAKLTVMDLFDQAFEGEDGFEGNCSPTNTHSTLKKNYEKSRFVNGEELSTTLMKKSPNKWKLLPEFNHEDGPGYVGTFRNAFISGPYSVVFDCNIEFFAGGCDFDKAAKFPLQKALVTPPTSMQRVEEAVLVGQHFGKHFYHWLVEGFLRLALVHEYLIENPNLKIIHYRQDNSAVFFEMLSIDPSRHVVYDPDEIYFVKKLIVPSATPCSRALSSAALVMNKLLRKAVAERFPHLNDAVKLQKIVVHKRKDGAERSFLNHKKLVRSLQARFKDTAEVVEFKHDDDAWEAAKLHYNADVIVTPHGAGASNVLFSKAHHVAVVEIHPYYGSGEVGLNHLNECNEITSKRLFARVFRVQAHNGIYSSPFIAPTETILTAVEKALRGETGVDEAELR